MRKFLSSLILFWSLTVSSAPGDYSSPYLVTYLFDNLRIVLAREIPCTHGMEGKNAVVHRLDGLYIQGCWILEPGNELMVRINWVKGDFSILPLTEFEPAGESEGFNKP